MPINTVPLPLPLSLIHIYYGHADNAYFSGIGSDMTTKLKDMLSSSAGSEYGIGTVSYTHLLRYPRRIRSTALPFPYSPFSAACPLRRRLSATASGWTAVSKAPAMGQARLLFHTGDTLLLCPLRLNKTVCRPLWAKYRSKGSYAALPLRIARGH